MNTKEMIKLLIDMEVDAFEYVQWLHAKIGLVDVF